MRSRTLLVAACLCCAVACRAPGESAPVETSELMRTQPAEPEVATVDTTPLGPSVVEADAVEPIAVEPEVPERETKELTPEERLAEIERRTLWLEENRRARTERRASLQREAAKNPGWKLYQSESYFYLSDLDDGELLEELMARAELVRSRLAHQFPPQTPIGGAKLPSSAVIRVFDSQESYYEYGGPYGSTAYYAAFHEEAVLVLDPRQSHTWAGLQHILAHEYLLGALKLAPPPWLLYAVAELYSGMQLDDHQLQLPEEDERLSREAMREEELVPLQDLLNFSAQQFRGDNSYGTSAYSCVLQAWSLAYFLTVSGTDSDPWSPVWEGLLTRCVETAVQSAARGEGPEQQAEAIQATLAEVDLDSLEAVWRAWLRQRWLAGHPEEAEAQR